MALADIVLEGLTLILVIALGAVLIGGLSYLTTTTASANNARLITAGTYVYLAGPTYINGTLYVPMYNIGEYTVDVKYLFVEGLNGVQEYATNIILKPGRYYVYELSIDYTPKAVTIVVSPTRDPKLVLEFNSNVSTPGPIALTPISQGSSGGGLIAVSVVDPYNAGWTVSWSYSGQSYSLSKSTSYAWYINPPYVPIQISFKASITQNPTGYTCQINPTSITATYSGGGVQQFTVTCTLAADIVIKDYYYGSFNQYGYYICGDPVSYTINYWGNATGTLSGQVPCLGWNSNYNITYAIPTNGTIYWELTSVSIPSGTTCTISPTSGSVNPGQVATITFSCLYWPYNNNNGNTPPPSGGNNPPPSNNNACPVEPPSVSSSPSGAPQPTSSASVSSIPYGQSEQVTFYYNAQESGNNYIFQYWVIGGQTYYQTNPSITETLACTTPGGTLTGPSGTAYYQYQPPGGVVIHPDTIDLTQSSETYNFTWTSAWSGTGSLGS